MSTSDIQDAYLKCQHDISFYTNHSLFVTHRLEGVTKIVTEQQGLEEDWWQAYDDGMLAQKDCKVGGTTYVHQNDSNNNKASVKYANAVTKGKFDEELLEKYSEIEYNFEALEALDETQLQMLRSLKDSLKAELQAEAQDTHQIQGG